MAKFKNCFHPVNNPDGDTIGSYLLASDGTALTHTGGALDVNIQSSDISISVAESDVYAEDSAHTSGNEGGFVLAVRNDTLGSLVDANGDYAPFQVNASGELYVTDSSVLAELQGGISIDDGGGSITVDAVDLDIRDLSSATDSVAAVQSGTWSVQVSDGVDTLAVNADGSVNVVATQAKDTTIVSAQPTVGTTAGVLVATASEQTTITVRNEGDEAIFVGPAGVTVSTGFKIDCGEVYTFQVNADLYAIAAASTVAGDIHTLQIAA